VYLYDEEGPWHWGTRILDAYAASKAHVILAMNDRVMILNDLYDIYHNEHHKNKKWLDR